MTDCKSHAVIRCYTSPNSISPIYSAAEVLTVAAHHATIFQRSQFVLLNNLLPLHGWANADRRERAACTHLAGTKTTDTRGYYNVGRSLSYYLAL